MKERLCQSCVNEGLNQCFFVATQNKIVNDLPPSNKQTPVAKDTSITIEAAEALRTIAEERIRARDERLCPQVNYQSSKPKFIKHF